MEHFDWPLISNDNNLSPALRTKPSKCLLSVLMYASLPSVVLSDRPDILAECGEDRRGVHRSGGRPGLPVPAQPHHRGVQLLPDRHGRYLPHISALQGPPRRATPGRIPPFPVSVYLQRDPSQSDRQRILINTCTLSAKSSV